MAALFSELGFQPTPLGDLSLRRRTMLSLGVEVYEVKLGDEYLMSSLFTESERELGRLGIARAADATARGDGGHAAEGARSPGSEPAADSLPSGEANSVAATPDRAGAVPPAATPPADLDVVVGGLGLGYTAQAVLESPRVRSLVVVELFGAVIEWHQRGLVPMGTTVADDPRCRLVEADFFAAADADSAGFDPEQPGRTFGAILVDIDHTPDLVLDAENARLYTPEGLAAVSRRLNPGGVFGVWSDKPEDVGFTERLRAVFGAADAHAVTFDNPLRGSEYTQTVYLAG
ncbi:MAG: spermidine synthase [Alkalispirochaeta sp.]